ncbi:MAG TPA: hypothetical protein VLM76_13500 [Patescibacteria group bacterium]|nr:hypothetical protein [Patescibacteria group bacterium]
MMAESAYLRRKARLEREAYHSAKCSHCGHARINVIHETDREHAPEGLAYYADVPFCEFEPSINAFGKVERVPS